MQIHALSFATINAYRAVTNTARFLVCCLVLVSLTACKVHIGKPVGDIAKWKADYILGVKYETGDGVPRNTDRAYLLYKKGAFKGYAPSQAAMGIYYYNKAVNSADLFRARTWCEYALMQADTLDPLQLREIHYVLGEFYYWGGGGATRDTTQALQLYEKAAAQGQLDAQLTLATLYSLGQQQAGGIFSRSYGPSVTKNPSRALFWLQEAGLQGHAESQYQLGQIYQNRGGRQNLDMALKWYQLAAAQNHRNAYIQVMLMTNQARHYPCYVRGFRGIPIRQPGIARKPDDWCL